MKEEIRVGVEFLRQFLTKYGNKLHQAQIDLFALKLALMLEERYENHWYETMPMKGQAFRCLRVKRSENYVDPVLEKLLFDLKLNLNQLGLPNDFTLWIDPGEVSVRFGDQVGYTYTIARLNTSPTSHENIAANRINDKPCLVVQNAENILFDEKLTAFIRQNSCNNTNDEFIMNSNDDLGNDFDDDIIINELIKLSAEKRTISPPHAAISSSFITSSPSTLLTAPKTEIKRQNSSNIAIVNNLDQSKLTSIGNTNNQNSNRLSFNDSCYYSSSSSSCASSFGSSDDTNFLMHQFGWFNNSSNLKSPDKSNSLLSSESNTFYKDSFNYDQQFNQTSSLFSDQQSKFIQPNSFGFTGFNQNSQNNLYGNTNNSFETFNKLNYLNLGTNSIYSDASSERSDTPNSCITNSSYLMIPSPLSFISNSKETNYFDNNNYDLSNKNDSIKAPLNQASLLNAVGSPVNSSSTSSSASDVSTKTIGKHVIDRTEDEIKLLDEQIDNNKMDLLVESSIEESKMNRFEKNVSTSPNSNSQAKADKKEETYCGYVESFPYYYKLNRLYNALAVQKMQTDRLRKTGVFNNNSTTSSISTTPNNTPNTQQFASPNNNSTGLLYRNLNSNSPKPNLGTSPNQYNRYNGITSPSSSPSQISNNNNSSILNSTSPTGVNMSKHFNQRVPNNLNNLGIYFSFSKTYLFYLILI